MILRVEKTENIANGIYKTRLSGDIPLILPGQFINIKLDGFYLRRPISVCDCDNTSITIVYKTVGDGTRALSNKKPGDKLDVLLPLGNGFNATAPTRTPLLIGGGVGTPPLYLLAKRLFTRKGRVDKVTVILGFSSLGDVFFPDMFSSIGCDVHVMTVDGSFGNKGLVTDAMDGLSYDYIYCCGPEPMLKAVYTKAATSGEYSFEERMGCGFGACMGCSCETKYGNLRICKDGPVLKSEVIKW